MKYGRRKLVPVTSLSRASVMQIIPVLDILNSVVVRGVAGDRSQYRPVESRLTSSAQALDVANAIQQQFGWQDLYVADLDAILHDNANFEIYEQLSSAGFRLIVDSGLKTSADAEAAFAAGVQRVIVGLETWPTLASLEMLVHKFGEERVIFSLDLRGGQVLRTFRDMLSSEPIEIAAAVIEAGVQQLVVLDLASVGTGSGISTLPLCREIQQFSPSVKLITGGGVRQTSDLIELSRCGLSGVLVASALHDGTITAVTLAEASLSATEFKHP